MTKNETDTLIFVHIPRSGGSTFKALLLRLYPEKSHFFMSGNTLRALDKFSSMPEATRQRYKLVYIQHAAFGVHAMLPQASSYITFLRDPWERTVSDFFHASRANDHSFYPRAQQGASLEDFVIYRTKEQGITNPMTRMISGINPYKPFAPLPSNALNIACENIERYYKVAGLTERYDKSLLLMKRFYGWRNIYYTNRNVGKPVLKNLSCHPGVLETFREMNQMDDQLYRHAAERLDKTLREQDADFKIELKQFQALNSIYQAIFQPILNWMIAKNRQSK